MSTSAEIRILGLDPGLTTTGWGAIACKGNNIHYLDSGLVTPQKQDPLPMRLQFLYKALCTTMRTAEVSEIAIESVFLGKNPQTAFAIGQARAAALLAAEDRHCCEYSPRTIKKAVTSSGNADKIQVRRMITYLLPESPPNMPCHASDALAVALCHAFLQQTRKAWTQSR